MMRWMGKVAVVGAVLVCALSSGSVDAAELVKVGVMDTQVVMERSKTGKLALEDLKAYSMTRQNILKADEQELKDLEQAVLDPNSKLSEAAKQEKQGQYQSKWEAYQRRGQVFSGEVQQKQQEMVAEYGKKITAAAQVVAQKEGYIAILEKGSEAQGRIVFYYQPSLDVTDLVVKEFDQQNP